MANADNINIIIERIRDEEVGFSMTNFFDNRNEYMSREHIANSLIENRHACGTVACIAGHAFVEATQTPSAVNEFLKTDSIISTAAEYLGIEDIQQARKLFLGTGNGRLMIDGNGVPADALQLYRHREEFIDYTLEAISREDAIRALEILRDEGVVDWDKAILEPKGIRYAYLPGRI